MSWHSPQECAMWDVLICIQDFVEAPCPSPAIQILRPQNTHHLSVTSTRISWIPVVSLDVVLVWKSHVEPKVRYHCIQKALTAPRERMDVLYQMVRPEILATVVQVTTQHLSTVPTAQITRSTTPLRLTSE
jgi:hypothetical protein